MQKFYKKDLPWQGFIQEYILFHNLPRFIPVEEEKVLADQTFDMLQRVVYQDLRNFYPENEVVSIFKLLSQLAASDEINPEPKPELPDTEKSFSFLQPLDTESLGRFLRTFGLSFPSFWRIPWPFI
ncbi:hypothetical protein [Thermosulfurimonas dismutans]|uniref:Uncharacterized protein n=1 Tax=Thermosulfurimonas dismutans TaxID=999894 RepID=A0A179D1B8_9BACT|nr:hypothetical protein [Thermosulfurimonas dismutans]OAQ19854.1 hypothetical protein TDIS_2072 [Thermosulfurimonas dismutans]